MEDLKQSLSNLFGIRPDCKNGGVYVAMDERCRCKQFYEGEHCERIICKNKSIRVLSNNTCACPDDIHYEGDHCEVLTCEHQGRAIAETGECRCPASYSGRYCSDYSNPWGIIIGSLAGLLLFFVICWMICQWYWGKKEAELDEQQRTGNGDESEAASFLHRYRYRYNNATNRGRGIPAQGGISSHNNPNCGGVEPVLFYPPPRPSDHTLGSSIPPPPGCYSGMAIGAPPSFAESVTPHHPHNYNNYGVTPEQRSLGFSSSLRLIDNPSYVHPHPFSATNNTSPTRGGQAASGLPPSGLDTQISANDMPMTPPPSYEEAVRQSSAPAEVNLRLDYDNLGVETKVDVQEAGGGEIGRKSPKA